MFVEPKLGMVECCVIFELGQVDSLVLLHKFLLLAVELLFDSGSKVCETICY